jgi:hypothetical protein
VCPERLSSADGPAVEMGAFRDVLAGGGEGRDGRNGDQCPGSSRLQLRGGLGTAGARDSVPVG